MISQEKRTFRIRDKYIDRDSEYLLQENEPDVTLDQQLLEDLQKKKSDLRYIEMQVMEKQDVEKVFICHFFSHWIKIDLCVEVLHGIDQWYFSRPSPVGILVY